jgi:UDP:flavonoid glycosyltransferase YjiC (YdhE family)
MKVVFVVGPALGHVGRALNVAKALRELQPCEIVFVGTNPGKYLEKYVSPNGFKIVPLGGNDQPTPYEYANRLESALSALNPAAIVFDLSPYPWLLLAHIPPVPQVYLTNYFVTRMGSQTTSQDQVFAANKSDINVARKRADLPILGSVRDLYEKDRVILADPRELLPHADALPENYTLAGAIWWEPESDLPEALESLDNILFISLGSTGVDVPHRIIDKIATCLDIRQVVIVSTREATDTTPISVPISYYRSLPGSRVLERSAFAITQGGAGSCYQALSACVPMGIWPAHLNHYLLGKRLEELGVGFLLDADSIETTLQHFSKTRGAVLDKMNQFSYMNSNAASLVAAENISKLFR